MILYDSKLELQFDFSDSRFQRIVIESPIIFRDFIIRLLDELNSNDANFSVVGKEDFTHIWVIMNPIQISLNDSRTIVNYLTKQFSELSINETLWSESNNLVEKINEFASRLIRENYDGDIEFDRITIEQLVKIYKFRWDLDRQKEENFVDAIIKYVQIISKVLKKKLFVFNSLLCLLSESEAKYLCERLSNLDVDVLFLEHYKTNREISTIIIDEQGVTLSD